MESTQTFYMRIFHKKLVYKGGFHWLPDKDFGVDLIENLAVHFKEPLQKANYDDSKVLREWKMFKNFVGANYAGIEATVLWKKVFQYKQIEYPNLCLLAEIILCLSGSNSTVERAFSVLTLFMSDRRLRMKHNLVEQLLLIKVNDKIWTQEEHEDIIQLAAQKYLEKRQTKTFTQLQPPFKMPQVDHEAANTCEESSSPDESDFYGFFSETESDTESL